MLNKLKKIFFVMIIFMTGLSLVMASENDNKEKNLVNIYLFYSDTCPHCAKEKELLDEIMDKYDNVRLYKYEIGDEDNSKLLDEVASLYDTTVSGVPFTVIGDKVYKGFSYENSKVKFMGTVDYYSNYGYVDKVGECLGVDRLPKYKVVDNQKKIDEYISEYNNYKLNIPLIGTVDTKKLTLPVIAVLIGLVDGFNPCAMWVLLFLISMLIGMNDKKKMVILGLTFLLSSALIYLLFMVAWINVASLLVSISYIRISIGIIALIGAVVNIYGYFKHRKDSGCNVVSDNKRTKIFDRIKKFTHERNYFLAILGVIVLACSVNIVELACSAGLPVMFSSILSMNNLTLVEEALYIALYMLFFLLDDLIVFFIAVRTMQLTGFSTKYGKIAKIVGGILLFIIGILLIFKPEWIMFNF